LLGRRGRGGPRRGRGANEVAAGAPGETARCETQTGEAAAEAVLVDLLEIEARLERRALQRRAPVLAFHPQRPGRPGDVAHRPGAAETDDADHRAVMLDATGAGRALETAERVKLAGDETLGFIGPHFPGGDPPGGEDPGRRRDKHRGEAHELHGVNPLLTIAPAEHA